MRLAVLAFACGVWLVQTLARLPSIALCAATAGAALFFGLAAWAVRRNLHRAPRGIRLAVWMHGAARACVLAAAFAIGFLWAVTFAQWRLADQLAPEWEGREVVVTGVISDLPRPFGRGVSFPFKVEEVAPSDAVVPHNITLAWYDGLAPDEFQEVQPVRAGERWRFTVRLRRPHGNANPHNFDYEASLLEDGTRATGSIAAHGEHQRIDTMAWTNGAGVPNPAYMLARLREKLRERLWDLLPGERYTGVLVALAIGDQRAIDAEEWLEFARTGVSHLMSISGLHITMVSGLFGLLVFTLWRRLSVAGRPLALLLPAQKSGALASAFAATFYCLLTGFAVPAQRTLYMVCGVAIVLWFDRVGSATRMLSMALLVVLILDPWAVLSPGFWLSFGAVAVIFYVVTGRVASVEQNRFMRVVEPWWTVQWAVTIGLVPLTLVLFDQVSIVSPIANAVAIPLVSAVITPLALLGTVLPFDSLAHGVLKLALWVLDVLDPFLGWLSRLNAAVWEQHAPAPWTIPLAMIGILWSLAPRGFPARYLGLVMLLPLYVVAPSPPPRPGGLSVAVLDVGQGLAVVVRTAGHTLIYDTGSKWSAESDSGGRIIAPYLRGEGIVHIDKMVISHDDNDHSGGAQSVLAAIPTSELVTSLDSVDAIANMPSTEAVYAMPPESGPTDAAMAAASHTAGVAAQTRPLASRSLVPWRARCRRGERWSWDGVDFEFLYPDLPELADAWLAPNERSCVLRVDAAGGSVLLTGDIERGGERLLLDRQERVAADILIAPHHGSATSSTQAFAEAVAPRDVVFAVGYRNRFGHPRHDVWERYATAPLAAQRWRSDRDGEVQFDIGAAGITVQGWREAAARYWWDAPAP